VAFLGLAGCGLAGCAQPDEPVPGQLGVMRLPSPDALVRSATARLTEGGTGAFTETMTARRGDAQVVRTITGEFDLDSTRARMTTRYSASGPDAVTALLGQPVELDSLASEQVRDGSVMYLTKPSWPGAERGRWIRYEGQWLGGFGRQWSTAVNPPWEPDYDMADPAPTPLFSLPLKMSDAGRFESGTAEASRYRISVPLSEARSVIGASALFGADGPQAPGGAGPGEEIPLLVEVDRAGALSRIELDATRLVERSLGTVGAVPRPPVAAEYRYELTLTRLGEPVRITMPAAAAQRPGGVWVQDLRAGTCLAADADRLRHVFFTPVGCDRPHRYEVFARIPLGTDADPYPGRRQLEQLARERCEQRFGEFVGIPAGDSTVLHWTAPPGEGPWLQGGRLAPCVLDPGRDVTGTLRDSGG
jgi:hypothetical protein